MANNVGDRALELSFAALQVVMAAQLLRRAARDGQPETANG